MNVQVPEGGNTEQNLFVYATSSFSVYSGQEASVEIPVSFGGAPASQVATKATSTCPELLPMPYRSITTMVADYQPVNPWANAEMYQAKVYKPHITAIDPNRGIWISANERGEAGQYKAGISIFKTGSNQLLSNVIIDEPMYNAETAPNGAVYNEEAGSIQVGAEPATGATTPSEEPQSVRDPALPPFVQTVKLPIVLPPTSKLTPQGTDAYGRPVIYAPMGSEAHSRHPHDVEIDTQRNLAYLLVEHSGMSWNKDRTDFVVSPTTDQESGFTLVFDISNPSAPQIVTGYMDGHGAHELAVDENNGWVYQGNHENSPGVEPTNFVDVFNTTNENPYGFIDTGYYNAIQGIQVDPTLNRVYGVTHVGQKMFTFAAGCEPTLNANPTVTDGQLELQYGANCILGTTDLRAAFDQQVAEAGQIWQEAQAIDAQNPQQLPSVLHYHDLTEDPVHHKAYMTLHAIHHAEHTGLPSEVEVPETEASIEGEDTGEHFMGRWVSEVDVDPASPTFDQVNTIDLSNGVSAVEVPNVESPAAAKVGLSTAGRYDKWFVHAHYVAVDPARDKLYVSGEHTGNLGVVDLKTDKLQLVIPITLHIPGTGPVTEPHVHGVRVDSTNGFIQVTDEGTGTGSAESSEGGSYESVSLIDPNTFPTNFTLLPH